MGAIPITQARGEVLPQGDDSRKVGHASGHSRQDLLADGTEGRRKESGDSKAVGIREGRMQPPLR